MVCLLRPALERGDSEQGQHAVEDVVKVEVAVDPLPGSQLLVIEGVLHVLQEEASERTRDRR